MESIYSHLELRVPTSFSKVLEQILLLPALSERSEVLPSCWLSSSLLTSTSPSQALLCHVRGLALKWAPTMMPDGDIP